MATWIANMGARADQGETIRYALIAYTADNLWDGGHRITNALAQIPPYPEVEIVALRVGSNEEIEAICGEFAHFWVDGQVRKPGEEAIQVESACFNVLTAPGAPDQFPAIIESVLSQVAVA